MHTPHFDLLGNESEDAVCSTANCLWKWQLLLPDGRVSASGFVGPRVFLNLLNRSAEPAASASAIPPDSSSSWGLSRAAVAAAPDGHRTAHLVSAAPVAACTEYPTVYVPCGLSALADMRAAEVQVDPAAVISDRASCGNSEACYTCLASSLWAGFKARGRISEGLHQGYFAARNAGSAGTYEHDEIAPDSPTKRPVATTVRTAS
ncbi:hypothetical protein FN846DRAFT_893173 [Sphaerosporella brunnea]|uniref:Uncharacterized protein n=1 Tax=Sphaerosporella brunnea TaxID=1250544 RepID=A0A5J5EN93_9PEZI|nr:hypothetical protein FN846DRAFT_893173 [Sphaerosporella brunnea]